MRVPRFGAATALLLVCSLGLAHAAGHKAAKPRNAATPGRATGIARSADAAGSDVEPSATIVESRNERGDTVYTVSAARFDISPPLLEMATKGAAETIKHEEEEEEPSNPLLPPWRRISSDRRDPVVQPAVEPVDSLVQGGLPALAPATGFNFAGIGINGGSPSDANGSVGNGQFVETVNARYQVWSLDRGTGVATSILGPASINTLWAGFGGPCQTQNSGDPVVLFDKVAQRWLISQFTSSLSGGSYFQCVAVSTTANAVGSYARWAFAVPSGRFGDYPHFGVWTDAYYMTAHAFTSTSGTYVAGIFAAMDRPKMLAGNPAATWQVILDPSEGGHMAADLDGFAPPPTGAPGIFLSAHPSSMFIYRMKVDFVTPANTVKTFQAAMPIASWSGACLQAATPGACIPQPGSSTVLSSIGDRLMFRAAYRNYIDHETIAIAHSVDPSVAGVVSGVRWYDFRLSGIPDATCPSYPCTRQQGTLADVANGRSRWVPSIAMDAAENVLLGYSTSGKTNMTENHTIRYTGRAKDDPLGTMTAPEVTIGTGIRNNTSNNRWGDYTSMSVDPFDDCTFWYVDQYIPTATSSWGTRIASAAWPAGSGPGQCSASTCDPAARPAAAPTIGSATPTGANQIVVSWTGIAPTPGAYAIERASGACGSEGLYQPLSAVPGGDSTFTDTSVQGGLTYSYRVIAAADGAGRCQALAASDCVSATASGSCNLKPVFTGAASGTSADTPSCGVSVHWAAATSSCPLSPNIRYNVFRGTTPDFVPAPGNRIATCVPGPTSYLDAGVASGTTYYYVVRAEDDSSGNGGACGDGNEEANTVVVSGTAYGPGTQGTPGTWSDGGGDGTAFLRLNVAGAGDTPDQAWRFVTTAADPGANHTAAGSYAYRNAGPAGASTYRPDVCAEMQTPPLIAGAATTTLQYWERHLLEYHWDGVAVEYSRNGGPWTDVPAPSNSPLGGCAATDAITGWETLSCTGAPPANACGYPATKSAYNGPLASGTSCTNWATASTATLYAHRCHPITGLTAGDTIQFRWRFSSDVAAEFGGFYLDDIAVTSIRLPNSCTTNPCASEGDGSICGDLGTACVNQDACIAGVCHDNGFKDAGTACGSADTNACDASDSCDGAGLCQPNHVADGTSCGDAATACVNQDTCLAGACQDNGFAGAGTACGSASNGPCDNPDSCDGAGGCLANTIADGTSCSDADATTCEDACAGGVCSGTPTPQPDEINASVRFASDKATIVWADPGGRYNVYRGTNGLGPWSYDQTCFSSDQLAEEAEDGSSPDSGGFFYYLVSRRTACRESEIGRDGAAAPVPNDHPCAP